MIEAKEHKSIASVGVVISAILIIGLALSIYSERRISEIHAAKEYRTDILKDLPNAFVMGLTVGPFAFFTPKDSSSTPSLYERAILFMTGLSGWIGLGLIIYFVIRGGYYRNYGIFLGAGSLILSMSDAVEMLSGSWLSPIWALVIKCVDIVGIVFACIYWLKLRSTIRFIKATQRADGERP